MRRRLFAVEDTTAQVVWRRPTPGAQLITGLAAGSEVPGFGQATLVPPPGEERFRFVTMSDLHVGEQAFGMLRTMRDRSGSTEPYPQRCFRAALDEALEWGAQLIVLKGDLSDKGRPEEWRALADTLGPCPVPVIAVPGNHDVWKRASDGRPVLSEAGVDLRMEPAAHDVPGLRIVLGQSAVPGLRAGAVDSVQRSRLAELAAASPSGRAVVVLHHQPQTHTWRHYQPPGIPGPQANALLEALAAANANTVVLSGHTHRHRFWRERPVPVAETGSPKDYPGTWTGYVVHDAGLRQVTRRIADPGVLRWTDRTRWAALGGWGLWSPGKIADRCWVWEWPRP